MGSGCTGCGSTNDLFGEVTLDRRVKYTGPAIPELGICTGDFLDEVEAIILKKLLDYSEGIGISIPNIDLTTCEAFADCITCCDTCTDLPCLLDCYKNAICKLWDLVQDALGGPYNTRCLKGVNSNSKLKQIIQALIDQYCALEAAVAALQATVANLQTQINNINNNLTTNIGNFLLGAMNSCQGTSVLKKTGTGATAKIDLLGFAPIGAIMPFAGPLTGRFDASGKGIANTDACGWALCNGVNGTVDMRELVPMGAGQGTMGGGSNLPANTTNDNYGLNQLVGKPRVKLTGNQSGLLSHGHELKILPHSHRMKFLAKKVTLLTSSSVPLSHQEHFVMSHVGDSATMPYGYERPGTDNLGNSIWSYIAEDFGVNTGVGGSTFGEVKPVGNLDAREEHENRQASRALYFIQRIS